MAMNGNSSWDKIQQGVKDTERLIVQREYNASMVKARQTLEFMVKNLADQAGIVDESDLKGMIDVLYENRWISKTTCEHYHKIRMIGNKAAHEGDSNAYSANQAYHMLSQEVYTFADDYRNAKKGRKPLTRPAVQGSSQNRTGAGWGSSEAIRTNRVDSSTKRAGKSYGPGRAGSSQAARSRKRSGSQSSSFSLYPVEAAGSGAVYCAPASGGEACKAGKQNKRDGRSYCCGDHGSYGGIAGRDRKQRSGLPHYRCAECAAGTEYIF